MYPAQQLSHFGKSVRYSLLVTLNVSHTFLFVCKSLAGIQSTSVSHGLEKCLVGWLVEFFKEN